MKNNILSIAFLSSILFSCATKSNVPTTEVKKVVSETDIAEGKNLYENNCAKCHKLYEPKEFSASEWKPIVRSMQKKAHLSDEEGQKIYAYVANH